MSQIYPLCNYQSLRTPKPRTESSLTNLAYDKSQKIKTPLTFPVYEKTDERYDYTLFSTFRVDYAETVLMKLRIQ